METTDVLIVGAGLIGCSLARELARAKCGVVVVERGRVGCGASSAAAGLLSPALVTTPPGPLLDVFHESASLYESWVRELGDEGAGDVGYQRLGLLDVWLDSTHARPASDKDTLLGRPGRRVEVLSADDLTRLEPSFQAPSFGAAYFPDDAQVDPARLTGAVAKAAEGLGVRIREHEAVQRFEREGDRIVAVHTARARYHPGLVVLTAGAWTGLVGESLGVALPTRPVKGQLLLASCRNAPVRTPLFAGETLFVPRPDGTLLLGVTVEEAGFDERCTLEGLRTILDQTVAAIPGVGGLEFLRAFAGLRPATPDALPYMGPVPPLRDLWVSSGHYRKGILLAPLCARLMARSILADRLDEDLQPFKPTRRLESEVRWAR